MYSSPNRTHRLILILQFLSGVVLLSMAHDAYVFGSSASIGKWIGIHQTAQLAIFIPLGLTQMLCSFSECHACRVLGCYLTGLCFFAAAIASLAHHEWRECALFLLTLVILKYVVEQENKIVKAHLNGRKYS